MFIAIIPARKGSKGLPNKNIKVFNGHPLLAWSIKQALNCKYINKVYVSTDSIEIRDIAIKYGAISPSLRPSKLATDTSSTEDVLIHCINEWGIPLTSNIVLLQPTSPLRLEKSLDGAIEKFISESADSLLSVSETHNFFWKNIDNPNFIASYDYENRPRRQDISSKDKWFKENGSIYISKANKLLEKNNRLHGKISFFVMSEIESFEIDTEIDFIFLNYLMNRHLTCI